MNSTDYLDLRKISAIADYQFGTDIKEIFFSDPDKITIERSRNTNKIRYVFFEGEHFLTLRPTNGFFSFSILAAQMIINNTKIPRLRAVVMTDISKYIKMGRNVFCKHVLELDEELRPMDEIVVVNEEDELLGIGKLKLPVDSVLSFTSGLAISIRKGNKD